MPSLRKPSRICGTAAAACSRSTVMRAISEPARDSAATWAMVPSISAVSVLVIDCTTIGAPPPTATLPTMTCVVLCRALGPATSFCSFSWDGFSGLFMASRISGFGDIHQGDGGGRGAFVGIGDFLLLIQWLSAPAGVEGKGAPGAPRLTGILDGNDANHKAICR